MKKKIGLEKLQKEDISRLRGKNIKASEQMRNIDESIQSHDDGDSNNRGLFGRDTVGGDLERQRDQIMKRERDWLKNDLRPLTKI